MGRLATVDLENSERFGASQSRGPDLEAMLDGYTCTECGRCRAGHNVCNPRQSLARFKDWKAKGVCRYIA